MEDKLFPIVELRAGKASIDKIGDIYEAIESDRYNSIVIDLRESKYISPCFATLIASCIHLGENYDKKVKIRYSPNNEKSKSFLEKSGIVHHYKVDKNGDYKDCKVPFKKYKDIEETFETINLILDSAPVKLTSELRNVLFSRVSEVFSNAFTHGKNDIGVFSCGLPTTNNRAFVFSVYDAGIGICKSVNNYLGKTISPSEALKWAFDEGNSTLNGTLDYPRGAGLNLLESFVKVNNGRIDLVSNGGYCRITKKERKFFDLNHPIIGTMFSMSINTDTNCIYGLKRREG